MRTFYAALAAATLALASASGQACDDHHGECEIEDWRAHSPMPNTLVVEGVTTCDQGKARLRLYDREKFLGVDTAYIEGHTFKTIVLDVAMTDSLVLKASIEPGS